MHFEHLRIVFFGCLFIPAVCLATARGDTLFFTNEAAWAVATSDIDSFDTNAANIALSNEIASPPGQNENLGSTLTFDSTNTGLARSFRLDNLSVRPPLPAGLVFRDQENGLSGDRNISIGDADGWGGGDPNRYLYENDDFEVTLLDGPQLTAFGFFLVGNEGAVNEQLSIFRGASLVASFDAIPTSSSGSGVNFLGVVSTTPFDRILFDEDEGPPQNDDIAIRDFRFAAVPEPSGLMFAVYACFLGPSILRQRAKIDHV